MGLFRKRQAEAVKRVPDLTDRLIEHHRNLRLSSVVVDSEALSKDILEAINVLTLVGESEDRAVQCLQEIRTIVDGARGGSEGSWSHTRAIQTAMDQIVTVVRVAGRLHDDIPQEGTK